MRIEWDERKRLANIEKHGFDFADLSITFFADARIVPAKTSRFQAIGTLSESTVVVIFAALGTEAISIISVRSARKDERRLI